MSKYNAIKTATDANIKANGRKEITGPVLNAVLNAIIDSLGKYYQFVGLATPSLNPGTPDQNVAYVAVSQGTYEHFGGLTVGDGELTLLTYDGEWRKATVRVIPDKTSQLSNDTGFVTNAVNDLINYYTRSETYTKAEVDQMIAAIKQFRFELVNTLPTASADTMYIIYLVPSTDPATGDVKDEYITIENGGVYSWEKIGRTTIDLSNYPTRSEMTTAINNALAAYITGVSATVDNNTGIPSVDVSFSNGTIHLAFHNLKGAQGNPGSSVDYPFTLVNNVTTDDATQALTAAMGKYLQDELGQLEAEVDEFFGGTYPAEMNIEQGGIASATGADTTSNTRIRTANYIYADYINVTTSGSKVYVMGYKEDGTFVSAVGWITASQIVQIDGADKYRLCFAKAGDTNVTPSDFSSMGIAIKVMYDTHGESCKKLELSQYGITKKVYASNAASNRIQQFVPCSGIVRFRVTKVVGTPTYASYMVWSGTTGTPLGDTNLYSCEFGKVYTAIVPSNYTGLTFRTNTSTSVGTVLIEFLDLASNDANNETRKRYETVGLLYDVEKSTNTNTRISTFFPCTGAVRVRVLNTYGTPSGSYFRLYYGKEGATVDKIARGNTPYGATTDVYIPDDSDYTGITVFTTTQDSGQCTYRIIIEQLDTDEQKVAHNERILCIGDSITQFNGQNVEGSGVNRDGMRYSDYMHLFRPGVTITNIGIGGTRLAQRTAMSENPDTENKAYAALDMVSLVDAVCSGDFTYQDAAAAYLSLAGVTDAIGRAKLVDLTKIDIVTILGGTNDWAGSQSLGTADDTSKTTTMGALNSIISAILSVNPRIRIYVVLPPVRYYGNTFTDAYWCDTYKNGNNQTLLELCESIESVAVRNYTPTIDLHRALGWNKQNFWSFFISPDGTHPIAGFRWIADKIMHEIF